MALLSSFSSQGSQAEEIYEDTGVSRRELLGWQSRLILPESIPLTNGGISLRCHGFDLILLGSLK